MSCTKSMRILYMKEIVNEVDPVSRCPDFFPVDNMLRPYESLWWDGNVPHIDTNSNDLALFALPTLESLNIAIDFLSELKGPYTSCIYF